MLDAQTIATVKATIPLLVETGPKLTAHFYDRMFAYRRRSAYCAGLCDRCGDYRRRHRGTADCHDGRQP